MKKRSIRYYTARKLVMLALIAAMIMLVGYLYVDNGALQKLLLLLASILFFGSFIVMTLWFRCPVCGCPFMRKAMMLTACPACGYKLDDFVLGEKIQAPEEEEYYLADGEDTAPEEEYMDENGETVYDETAEEE